MALHCILLCLLVTAAAAFVPDATFESSTMMLVDLPVNATAIDPDLDNPLESRLVNYFGDQATEVRLDQHHYCLGTPIDIEFSDSNLPNKRIFVGNEETTQFPDTVDGGSRAVWSLFFQYPVLSYIDTSRKAALLNLTASLAASNNDGTILMPPFSDSYICLGAFETYAVSEYSEGFLMRIYLDNRLDVMNDDVVEYINNLHENFISNIDVVANDDADNRARRFRGRSAIYIPAYPGFANRDSNPGNNFHPGSTHDNRDDDPTLFAIFRGSWPHNLTDSDNQSGVGIAARNARRAASNPDPINYGLEAGDIVFAVFGSIFLFIMAALIVLGYFIHPFFLS